MIHLAAQMIPTTQYGRAGPAASFTTDLFTPGIALRSQELKEIELKFRAALRHRIDPLIDREREHNWTPLIAMKTRVGSR